MTLTPEAINPFSIPYRKLEEGSLQHRSFPVPPGSRLLRFGWIVHRFHSIYRIHSSIYQGEIRGQRWRLMTACPTELPCTPSTETGIRSYPWHWDMLHNNFVWVHSNLSKAKRDKQADDWSCLQLQVLEMLTAGIDRRLSLRLTSWIMLAETVNSLVGYWQKSPVVSVTPLSQLQNQTCQS